MGKKTHEQYVIDAYRINPNIIVLGTYVNSKTKIAHKCKIDSYEWLASPNDVLRGRGCPRCANKVITSENCIAYKYPEVVKYLVNKSDAYNFMATSHKKIELECPLCHHKRFVTISNLTQFGYSCAICGDGLSYPEKYMYNVLKQLNIEFYFHKTFEWSKHIFSVWENKYSNKEYDFVIPKYNIIIETHGRQHYYETRFTNRTLLQEQSNDILKENLAIDNGYTFIAIDCRISECEYIKSNLLLSKLNNILDFSNVNWEMAEQTSRKNTFVKNVADLWESGISILEIMQLTNLSHSTIWRYLTMATQIGWCQYSEEEAQLRRGKYISTHSNMLKGKGHPRWGKGKIVVQLNLDLSFVQKFQCLKAAERVTNINSTHIGACCRNEKGRKTAGGFKWMYIEDYEAMLLKQEEDSKEYLCNSSIDEIKKDSIT